MLILSVARTRWWALRNMLLKGSPAERRRVWLGPVWALLIGAAICWASYLVFDLLFVGAYRHRLFLLEERLPGLLLLWAFWMLALSGVSIAIHHLYTHREVALLLAAPIAPGTVFVLKLLDMVAANTGFFAMMGGPVALAYALARGAATGEYLIRAAVALALFAATPTCIGAMAALVFMRILPPGRLREILGAVGIAAVALAYVGLNMMVRRMQNPGIAERNIDTFLDAVHSPWVQTGPWGWAGKVLAADPGDAGVLGALALLLASALASVLLASALTERLHFRGWLGGQETGIRGNSMVRRGAAERALEALPGAVRAFLLKDLRTLGRDMRQLSLLLMPAAVVVVFLVNLEVFAPSGKAPPALLGVTLLPLLGMIATRVATSSFVGESQALWMALASPARARSMLLGKLAYTVCLTLPMGMVTLAAYGALYPLTGLEAAILLATVSAGTVGLSGIGVGIGGRFLEVASLGGLVTVPAAPRFLALGLHVVYSLLVAVVLGSAWGLTVTLRLPAAPVWTLAILTLLVLSAIAVVLPIELAGRRLASLEG